MDKRPELSVAAVQVVVSSAGEGAHDYWNLPKDKQIIVTHQEATHVGPRAVAALLEAGYIVQRRGREIIVRVES